MKQHTPKLSRLDVQILAAALGDEMRGWEPNVHAAYEDAKLALALRLVRELADAAPHELEDAFLNPTVIKLLEAGRAAARELPTLKNKLDGLARELKVLKAKHAQRTVPRQVKKGAKPKAPAPRPSSTTTTGKPAAAPAGKAPASPVPAAAAGAGSARPTTSTPKRSKSSAGAATAGAAPSPAPSPDPAPPALSEAAGDGARGQGRARRIWHTRLHGGRAL